MHEESGFAARLAIRELIELYSLSVTRGDWDTLAGCFHVDAQWRVDPPFGLAFAGRTAIRDGIAGLLAQHEFLMQMTHSISVFLSGDQATAVSLIEELGRVSSTSGGIRQYGLYHDELVRIDGRWTFRSRRFEPLLFDTGVISGSRPG